MLDIPLPWNGGLVLIVGGVLLVVVLLAPHPSPWRCDVCSARFPTEAMLSAHEARHASVVFPFESCGCSHDRVFHASGVGGCDRPGCGCRGFHLLNQRIA